MKKIFLILLLLPILAATSCKKSLKKSYIRFRADNHEKVAYTGDETAYQHMELKFNNRYTLFSGWHAEDDYFYIACNRSFDITAGVYVKGNTTFALDSVTVDFGAFNHDEYIEGSFYGFGLDSASGNRVTISEGEFFIRN